MNWRRLGAARQTPDVSRSVMRELAHTRHIHGLLGRLEGSASMPRGLTPFGAPVGNHALADLIGSVIPPKTGQGRFCPILFLARPRGRARPPGGTPMGELVERIGRSRP